MSHSTHRPAYCVGAWKRDLAARVGIASRRWPRILTDDDTVLAPFHRPCPVGVRTRFLNQPREVSP